MELKTGLWKKISKKNVPYLQGSCEIDGKMHNLTIFTNFDKKTEKSPDVTLFIEEWKENTGATAPTIETKKVEYDKPIHLECDIVDDIPF